MTKQLILGLGYSDIHGHGKVSQQLPLEHGDHVFFYKGDVITQNPQEPVYGSGAHGASNPLRYMADELAGHTGDDVAFSVAKAGTRDWHDGLLAWDRKALLETKAMLQNAFDDGFQLSTVVIAPGPGAADTDREVDLFNFFLHRLTHRVEKIFDGDQHFVVVPPHFLTPNHFDEEIAHRINDLRNDVRTHNYGKNVDVVLAAPNWPQANPFDGSHLDARGNELLGHRMAHSIFDDLSIGV
jgi:hypothetical protein